MKSLPQRLSTLTPKRRDGIVFLVGLLLLMSPVLFTMGFVSGGDHHYEAVEVVTTGDTLAYADESAVPPGTPISEDVACSGTQVERACALETVLEDSETLPLGVETDERESPARDPAIAESPYEFVQFEDDLYRAVYTTTDDGSVEVGLSSTAASTVLHAVSVHADESSVSSTVVEAAEEGEATSRSAVDVPQTPVVVDGEYYRVYMTEEADEGATTPYSLAIFFGAALGAVLLLSLTRHVRVSYNPPE